MIKLTESSTSQELYEPLWEEIYLRLKLSGIKIRGIWIADVAHQGASGILNENLLGNDRRLISFLIMLLLLIVTHSFLVRSFKRLALHDQSFSIAN